MTPTIEKPDIATSNQKPTSIPLTVLIAVRNEEKNIVSCVRCLSRVDQVIVIDSHSTDRTRELAEREGATVYDFNYDGEWPKKRNWALANIEIRNEWVMILDADEQITPELFDEISGAIQAPHVNGYFVRWKFEFLGRWMKHCWSHCWMPRLFRHGFGEYEDLGMRGEGGWDAEVHENVIITGRTKKLRNYLEHNAGGDLSFWIRKQNDFSDWRSRQTIQQLREPVLSWRKLLRANPVMMRKWMRSIYIRLPLKPTLMFIYLYIIKRGFLDGKAGFYFCRLKSAHELNICAKMYEMQLESLNSKNTAVTE